MRIILFAILAIITSGNLIAQEESEDKTPTATGENAKIQVITDRQFDLSFVTMPGQPMINRSMKNTFGTGNLAYSKIEGTPYLNPDYSKGELTLQNGKEFKNVELQVDLYSRDVIAAVDETKVIALNKKLYKSFVIPHGDQKFLYKKVNPEKPNDFYIVLFEDSEYVFFKDKHMTFREGSNYGLSKTAPKFMEREDYYIAIKDKKEANKIKLKMKDLISNLPKRKAKAFSEYMGKNEVNLKNEAECIKVLEDVSKLFKSSI